MIESQETPSPAPDIYKQPIKNKSKRTLKTDNPPQVQKDNVKTRTLTPQQELKQVPNNGKDTVVETIQQSPDKHVEPPNPPFNTLSSILLHLSYACRSQEVLYHTFKHKAFKGLPTIHASLPYICLICIKMKMSRLRKIELMHQHNLPPGTLLHMDFAFINEISIRGFTAYLRHTAVPRSIALWTGQ